MRELRDAACEYASRGWHVVPLRARNKQPITKHGLQDATDDLADVLQWWQPKPLALQQHNIGIVCHPSALVVIDVDPRHGGDDTFAEAERQLGQLPRTVEAETGGGGWHYYFRHPGGSLRGQVGQGVDVKDHGYVLAPPSLHPSGRPYEWSVDGHPEEVEVAELPGKWINALQVVTRRVERPDVLQSPDPLRRIPAATYVARITGREPTTQGWFQCPFHGEGQERTPSLKCDGHMWACYGCAATNGKRCAGGNIYEFAALTLGIAVPPRGADYLIVKDWLKGRFR